MWCWRGVVWQRHPRQIARDGRAPAPIFCPNLELCLCQFYIHKWEGEAAHAMLETRERCLEGREPEVAHCQGTVSKAISWRSLSATSSCSSLSLSNLFLAANQHSSINAFALVSCLFIFSLVKGKLQQNWVLGYIFSV